MLSLRSTRYPAPKSSCAAPTGFVLKPATTTKIIQQVNWDRPGPVFLGIDMGLARSPNVPSYPFLTRQEHAPHLSYEIAQHLHRGGLPVELRKRRLPIDYHTQEFAGLDIGGTIRLGATQWTVVGSFSAEGGAPESEMWADASVLQGAYQRGNFFQSVRVRLDTPEAFQTCKDALTSDPRLNVKVLREAEFFAEQSTLLNQYVTTIGYFIAFMMGTGAVFGALNTMYGSVAARVREIATLRALGFGPWPVLVSILVESLALALIGGVVGGVAAYVAFDGFGAATMNWQTFSQVAFAFRVTPELLVQAAIIATVIGLIGGAFPALRAARQPIASALRES